MNAQSVNFSFDWSLKDLARVEKRDIKVVSTFSCGGGSSMGYELSGCNVVAANDIDKTVLDVYGLNLPTKIRVEAPVKQFFEHIKHLVGSVDILNDSPPCSTFSMAGSREDSWDKDKVFREGQAKQKLSELFFEFLELGEKLKPKVIVAENVKGMLLGNAKSYCSKIMKELDRMGYAAQLFLVDASTCGVPQKRERVFFVARLKSLGWPNLKVLANQKPIPAGEALSLARPEVETSSCRLPPSIALFYHSVPFGKRGARFFSWIKLDPSKPSPTVTAKFCMMHPTEPRLLSTDEVRLLSSFPSDYNFNGTDGRYLMGMSVPPLMAHCVSKNIVEQWFDGKA